MKDSGKILESINYIVENLEYAKVVYDDKLLSMAMKILRPELKKNSSDYHHVWKDNIVDAVYDELGKMFYNGEGVKKACHIGADKFLKTLLDKGNKEYCTCADYEYEKHTCPFETEINDDYGECNCCPYCEQQCDEDI